MALLDIAEIFGFDIGDNSRTAAECREQKRCPFRRDRCNKNNLADPLGVCTFGDGVRAGAVCPNRFLEDDRIFRDAGRLAFGSGSNVLVAPEMRILRVRAGKSRRIGKVDYIIGRLNPRGEIKDFAALEVQAVYFSGASIREPFNHFLKNGSLPAGAARRLDYRSSAQKRLMPQLSLKVPVFRRWGKKFFIAVDDLFFESLPITTRQSSIDNSEVTWLVYSIRKERNRYRLSEPRVIFTLWDEIVTALREGEEPTPAEILAELSNKRDRLRIVKA